MKKSRYKIGKCKVPDCPNTRLMARGWCSVHYQRWLAHGDPLGGGPFQPNVNVGKLCKIQGCKKSAYAHLFCERHYERWRKYGDPLAGKPIKEARQKGFPGDPWTNKQGYRIVYFPEHPNARKSGSLAEHVLIMSEHLERPLYPDETVHHKNGVRDDNRIENLELWSSSHPSGQRVIDKINWAKEILHRYDPQPHHLEETISRES